MSAMSSPLVTGVDFVGLPTRDLASAVEFYGTTLGIPMSVHMPDRNFAEFETGNLTLNILHAERMGLQHVAVGNPVALHVEDVPAARAELESKGVAFMGDIVDTGVCHMAFFSDPDGNALMLHHRYRPRQSNA
jgi:predicted enzyme related to lactoylglutathione lyase